MARLSLNAAARGRFRDDLRIMLSPLDYPSLLEWQRAVLDRLKASLGADKAAFLFPIEGTAKAFSEEIAEDTRNEYPARVSPFDKRWSIWQRQVDLGVFDRPSIWGEHYGEVRRSAYYHEYVIPNRLYDVVGMTHRLPGTPVAKVSTVATIWLHHDRDRGRRFGESGLEWLRMLLHAFKASVDVYQRQLSECTNWCRSLGAIELPFLLVDMRDRVLHETPILTAILAVDPEGDQVRNRMRMVARTLALVAYGRGAASGHADVDAAPLAARASVTRFTTRSGSYVLRATLAPDGGAPHRAAILVRAERLHHEPVRHGLTHGAVTTREWMDGTRRSYDRARRTGGSSLRWSDAELVKRFHLTPAECHVARLLAGGTSVAEIAEWRGRSESTVRNQVEKILRKTGTTSMAAAVATLHTGGALG